MLLLLLSCIHPAHHISAACHIISWPCATHSAQVVCTVSAALLAERLLVWCQQLPSPAWWCHEPQLLASHQPRAALHGCPALLQRTAHVQHSYQAGSWHSMPAAHARLCWHCLLLPQVRPTAVACPQRASVLLLMMLLLLLLLSPSQPAVRLGVLARHDSLDVSVRL